MPASSPFRPSRGQRLTAHLFLLLLCVPALLPMAWMVSTSLKTDAQVYTMQGKGIPTISLASLLPHPVKWQNYPEALRAVPFIVYLKNTLWLCSLNVLGAVLSSAI